MNEEMLVLLSTSSNWREMYMQCFCSSLVDVIILAAWMTSCTLGMGSVQRADDTLELFLWKGLERWGLRICRLIHSRHIRAGIYAMMMIITITLLEGRRVEIREVVDSSSSTAQEK